MDILISKASDPLYFTVLIAIFGFSLLVNCLKKSDPDTLTSWVLFLCSVFLFVVPAGIADYDNSQDFVTAILKVDSPFLILSTFFAMAFLGSLPRLLWHWQKEEWEQMKDRMEMENSRKV